jgi:hypothetical protein
MSPTVKRPSAPGGDTHHRFDFLHGIDLEGEHVRHAPSRTPWIVGAIVLLLVAAVVGLVLFTGPQPTPEPAVEPAALSLHDSGIEQALQARQLTREALIAEAHDSGIEQALQAQQLTREALIAEAHDSGIAQAVRERNAELNAMHDSGIAYRLRNP